jgi:hypothetical protein
MKAVIITVLLSSCLFAFSQDNYKQAYYISNAGDTVNGWINFSTDYNNSIVCEFKNAISDRQAELFLPGQISSYRFENEDFFYVSHEVDSGKYFLQYLVNGEMNLYFRADENDIRYFYFEENGKITAITKKEDRHTATHIEHDMSYKKSLAPLFNTYPTIVEKVNSNKFDQKTMMSVVEEYHGLTCTSGESCIVYATRQPDKRFLDLKFSFALSGYAFNKKLIYSGTQIYAPGASAGLAFYYPRVSQHTSTILELSFLFPDMVKLGNSDRIRDAALPSVIMRAGQRYIFSDAKIAPFGEAGVHSGLGVYLAGGLSIKTAGKNRIFVQAGCDTFQFSILGAFAKLIYQI